MTRRRRAVATLCLVTALVAVTACDSSSDTTTTPTKPKPPAKSAIFQAACNGTVKASTAGTLASPEMGETSGIVVSKKHPDTIWTNNDSGDIGRVFAISTTGALKGIYPFNGATALDWEDIAMGPGPQANTPYLYTGDIGDNTQGRPNVVVYRVAEPKVVGDGGTYPLDGVEALTLQYPDGPHDAEALMVDPRTGDLFIVVKHLAGGPAAIYRAPGGLAAGSTTVLTQVGVVQLGIGLLNAVTASDISRDGSTIGIRTYGGVRLWNRGTKTVVAALAAKPCEGPIPFEIQGETIGLAPSGREYFTVSEGVNVPLHRFSTSGK